MTSSPSTAEGSAVRVAFAIVALATLGRLAVATWLPAGVDEAYTIGIARQLSLSYFDHPPLHIWLVGLWARLIGSEHIALLRLPFVALGVLSSALMWRLTARLFGAGAALWAVALFNLAPVFGVAHGAFVLPDGPLLAVALGLALAMAPAATGESMSLRRWLLAGFCAGLALLSKYHGVLLVGGVFVFLLWRPKQLLSAGPWLAAALALAMFLPVLVWNGQHGWVSFGFQGGRSMGNGLRPTGPLLSLAQQAVYLLPWVLALAAWSLWRAGRSGPADGRSWLLLCLALPPILLFTLASIAGPGLPHWPMPGWLFALPLSGRLLAAGTVKARQVWGWVLGASAGLVWGLVGLVLLQVQTGALTQVFGGADPTDSLASWDGLAPAIEARAVLEGAIVAAPDWIMAGQLNYVLGGRVSVTCLCTDARHFRYLVDRESLSGRTMLLVTRADERDPEPVPGSFESVGPVETLPLMKQEHVAVPLKMRVGRGFTPGGRTRP